jgi:hypothetical protein
MLPPRRKFSSTARRGIPRWSLINGERSPARKPPLLIIRHCGTHRDRQALSLRPAFSLIRLYAGMLGNKGPAVPLRQGLSRERAVVLPSGPF